MVIRVRKEEIKAKDKRVPDRLGLKLECPPELASDELIQKMEMIGFKRVKPRDPTPYLVWRFPASVGPPPVHILRSLSTTALVRGDASLEEMLELGTERGDDGRPGSEKLYVTMLGDFFCANCRFDNKNRRAFLEGAGWFPLYSSGVNKRSEAIEKVHGNFPYVTKDVVLAQHLIPWMRDDAKKELVERAKREKENIRRSSLKVRVDTDPVVPMPEGEALQGFQDAGVNNLLRTRKSGVIYDDMGLGKAQSLDSKIMTPSGWKLMRDIQEGDKVIGSNGKPTMVTGVFPQGKLELFKVSFSDGTSTECCKEHLWSVNTAVRKKRKNSYRALSLKEIMYDIKEKNGNNKHYIPMVEAIDLKSKRFPINPYVLGVLLGDGFIKYHQVIFSTQDLDMIDFIKKDIPNGLEVKHKYNYDYIIKVKKNGQPNKIRRSLNELGLKGKGSDDKFIPQIYFLGSIKQRTMLLQGLLDTDGYVSKDNLVQFSSNSKQLADGVAEIVMSLGGNARKSMKISASNKEHYIVTISLPEKILPFRIDRKAQRYSARKKYQPTRAIVDIKSVGMKEAQCISVDAEDKLYVTDDYIVTHNTVQGIAYSNARPDLKRILVISKANMKYGWSTSFDRFSTRPHEHFIINGTSPTMIDPETGEERSAVPTKEELIGHDGKGRFDLTIINYDIVADHADFIRNTEWDLVILDEIHSVSNQDAIRTGVLFGDMSHHVRNPVKLKMSKKGVIIGLSGTPHPVIERMWAILSSLRPDVFGTGPIAKRIFINRYAPPTLFVKEFPNGFKKVMAIPGRPIREAELNRRLRASGFMTRRLKADMADLLPPKSRASIELPFTLTPEETKELSILEGQIEEVALRVLERTGGEKKAAVKNEGRARAIIDVVKGLHPKSPEFHEISRLRSRIGEIKAPYVAEYLIEETAWEDDLPADIRPKTVVFAHHKAVIAKLRDKLEEAYPGQVIVYDGSVTTDKKRFALEKKFQENDKYRFFLMSLSGASGITLTRANRLYMAEMDWDPTNLPQIEDRIWRMTQEQPCFIGYFMIPNSLDVQMGNRLLQRMQDSSNIYDKFNGVNTSDGFSPKADKKEGDQRQGELF